VWSRGTGCLVAVSHPSPGAPTFRGRISSQLHREFSDTLKGSHTGLRLFFTTCTAREADSGGRPGARAKDP
jgi:hypothetical protein